MAKERGEKQRGAIDRSASSPARRGKKTVAINPRNRGCAGAASRPRRVAAATRRPPSSAAAVPFVGPPRVRPRTTLANGRARAGLPRGEGRIAAESTEPRVARFFTPRPAKDDGSRRHLGRRVPPRGPRAGGETSSSSTPRVLAVSLASHRPPASPSRTRDRASAPGRPSPRRKTRTADAPGGRREHHRPLRRRAVSAPGEGKVGCARTMLLDRVKPLRCGSKEGRTLSVSGLFITPRARRETRKPLCRFSLSAFIWYRSGARFGFGRTEHGSVEARQIARIDVRTLARF